MQGIALFKLEVLPGGVKVSFANPLMAIPEPLIDAMVEMHAEAWKPRPVFIVLGGLDTPELIAEQLLKEEEVIGLVVAESDPLKDTASFIREVMIGIETNELINDAVKLATGESLADRGTCIPDEVIAEIDRITKRGRKTPPIVDLSNSLN